ncbi:MAG: hypothetical protein OXK16_15230 [bacterium]|nr:hypothetical protein [bacterium]MDE0377294.1 hypothetical protein [bacterium]
MDTGSAGTIGSTGAGGAVVVTTVVVTAVVVATVVVATVVIAAVVVTAVGAAVTGTVVAGEVLAVEAGLPVGEAPAQDQRSRHPSRATAARQLDRLP